jgi:hypothetical protein
MVKINKIPDADGKGFTIATIAEDVERIDPVLYFRTIYMESNEAKLREMLRLKNPPVPMIFLENVIEKNVAKEWDEMYQKIMAEKVPDFLFSALKTDNKKYQEKFLRGMQFTPDQLTAFYFRAYQELGYTFSAYSSEHLPNGTDLDDMPVLVRVTEDGVTKVGKTPLKDGELKQAITQRSAIYGKILDKGDEWHCFIITIESIAGNENWNDGLPHYHYISDKFGVSREEVVKQLKSKDYALFNLPHLELHGYGGKDKPAAVNLSKKTSEGLD